MEHAKIGHAERTVSYFVYVLCPLLDTKRYQRAQRRLCALRPKSGSWQWDKEQTEILARHWVGLGNTGVTKVSWLGVAQCGEMRHAKIKNIVAAKTPGCWVGQGVASSQQNEPES